jgi:glucosamine--fructose-6-phosphate aminotransferase (isomerizing)
MSTLQEEGAEMRGALMYEEMAQQPDVISNLAERRNEISKRVARVRPRDLIGIVLVARGSSDHAAIYGRYVLQMATHRVVALEAPSLHTLYGVRSRCDGFLAIAVSQSGRTPEITTVLKHLHDEGARTLAVTNEAGSPLGEAAEEVIELRAGEEQAVPATKTFTAQLAAFALIAEALGDVSWQPHEWSLIPRLMQATLDDPEPGRAAGDVLDETPGLITVGRGFMFSVALEAALKLKETAHLLAEGYSSADLRHGPVAVIERDFPVLAFTVPGRAAADMADLTEWLRSARRAYVITIGEGDVDVPIPPGAPEPLAPLVASVQAQQIALEAALRRNLDPDFPAGLTKVTPTT